MELKIAIVGCGRVTQYNHLPTLKNLEGLTVSALVDLDEQTLQAVSDYWGISQRFTSMEQMLDEADIDVVAVCAPATAHADLSIRALEAGKHVYIEKPLALTLDDCDKIIAAADTSDTIAMMGFNLRFHPQIVALKKWLHANPTNIHLIQSEWTNHQQNASDWEQNRRTGGGTLFDLAIHHVDLWRYIVGQEIDHISAHSIDTSDKTTVLSARAGEQILLDSSFCNHSAPSHSISVHMDSIKAELDLYRFDRPLFSKGTDAVGGASFWLKQMLAFMKALPHGIQANRRGGEYQLSYAGSWTHFANCIKQGQLQADSPTLADGRAALDIILKAIANTE